ncbi:WXG100 family type VII secretion target [Aeromicrobium sp. NPDC092404]|uniref:WXG100 family type VII secretion target n=1 Tax=Aeromicrobium sp. NPDC092404 TaxID=3154976 RepID=UPI003429F591
MNNGRLAVDFGGLERGHGDINRGAGKLKGRLDQLEAELNPLRADWTGAASESYQQAKAKWDGAMEDIRLLLVDIATQVSTSSADYQATESRNTSRFA